MKRIIICFVLAGAFMSCKSRKADMVSLEIEVTTTDQYCDGAMPDDAVLEMLNTPKVYADSTVYLANPGEAMQNIQPVTLNKSGKANLKLLPGTYELYYYNIPNDVKHEHPQEGQDNIGEPAPPPCPPDWKLMVSAQFEVIPGEKKVKVNLHRICDPCLEPRP